MTKRKDKCTCNEFPDYKGCCSELKSYMNDCKMGFKYHPAQRMFTFLLARDQGRQRISHCPWCGTRLPEQLHSLRMEILENEYGLDAPHEKEQIKKTPAEFLTDEWWKKRGL